MEEKQDLRELIGKAEGLEKQEEPSGKEQPVQVGAEGERTPMAEAPVTGAEVETREETETEGKNLRQELEEAQQQIADLKDRYLRKAAELENYKKRIDREFTNIIQRANEELILDLLPVVDDLERSLTLTKDGKDFDSLYKGVELIYQKLLRALSSRGLQPLESVGQEFDPTKHDALLQVESDHHPPNIVIEEHERGYRLGDRVIRPAKVVVSK